MENNNRPLLSICIPTFNRGDLLNDILSKYVDNPQFDNDVEIVISDNASTDSTEDICRRYVEKYSNIRYFKNEENINNKNFPVVLGLAKGEYLKLLNDWVYLDDEGLGYIKSMLKEHLVDKTNIFFSSNWIDTKYKGQDICICSDINDYISVVSTFITSNNFFGVWRDDWERIVDKEKYSEMLLQQDDWTYQLLMMKKGCIVYNKAIYKIANIQLKVRSGYNWFQVHIDNYYKIMDPYIQSGLINRQTVKKDKRHLLVHFIPELQAALIYNSSKYWKFDTSHTWNYLWIYYRSDPYFYYFIIRLYLVFFIKIPIKLPQKLYQFTKSLYYKSKI